MKKTASAFNCERLSTRSSDTKSGAVYIIKVGDRHSIPVEPLDRSKLVRWDRVARPGLIHIGKQDITAEFS